MATLTLPLRSDLEAFEFESELDGVTFGFSFLWNPRDSFWSFDLLNGDGDVLQAGVRAVIGLPLMWRALGDDLPAGTLIFVDTARTDLEPGVADLGARVQLLYIDAAEEL